MTLRVQTATTQSYKVTITKVTHSSHCCDAVHYTRVTQDSPLWNPRHRPKVKRTGRLIELYFLYL